MKHVLMIGGRDHTINKFQKLGINFSVIQRPDLVTEDQIKRTKKLLVMDYKQQEEVVKIVKVLHQIERFDTILSFAEYGLLPAAICSKELGLPSNDIFPIEVTRNKLRMRELLQAENLAVVAFKLCNDIQDVENFFEEIKFKPIIIKPSTSAGSRGVSFINNINDIESAWKWTSEVGVFPILAEEFIEGKEYSVETLSLNGFHEIAMITEKLTAGFPNFIEIGHQAPARLDTITKLEIERLVINFLNLIQQKTGPTHTEIKLTSEGPKIIESQTRIGGDQIWEMTELVSGIDQMTETICYLLDLPVIRKLPQSKAVAIRFFSYENRKIKDITGLDKAAALPGIIRVHCKAKSGDELGALKSSDSRQGYVLAAGESLEQAVLNVEQAMSVIVFN